MNRLTFGDWLLVALGVLAVVAGFVAVGEGCVAWTDVDGAGALGLLGALGGCGLLIFGLFLAWLGVRGGAGRLVRRED